MEQLYDDLWYTDGSLSFLFQSNGHWGTIVFPGAGGSIKALIDSLLIYRDNRCKNTLAEFFTKHYRIKAD